MIKEISVKANKTAEAVKVKWTFDIDSFNGDELLELAMRSLVIDAQRQYRSAAALVDFDANAWGERTFTKADFVAKRRTGTKRALTRDELIALLRAMPESERLEMLEQAEADSVDADSVDADESEADEA
jgi:hypothetical protein